MEDAIISTTVRHSCEESLHFTLETTSCGTSRRVTMTVDRHDYAARSAQVILAVAPASSRYLVSSADLDETADREASRRANALSSTKRDFAGDEIYTGDVDAPQIRHPCEGHTPDPYAVTSDMDVFTSSIADIVQKRGDRVAEQHLRISCETLSILTKLSLHIGQADLARRAQAALGNARDMREKLSALPPDTIYYGV